MSLKIIPIVPSNTPVNKIIYKHCVNKHIGGYSLFGQSEVFLSKYFADFAERINDFKVNQNDVWVITYPKSGTTWGQEMVWLVANNLNYEAGRKLLTERYTFLELSSIFNPEIFDGMVGRYTSIDTVTIAEKMPHTRFIKSHLPVELLPREIREKIITPKIIYVARNPKDVCISFYHHYVLLFGFTGTIDDFCELFLEDKVIFSPFWSHIHEFWNRRNDPNVLYLTYESMKTELPKVVRKIAKMFDKNMSDTEVNMLCDHLSFESMKNNPAVNFQNRLNFQRSNGLTPQDGEFIRRGDVDSYKTEMSQRYIKRFDEWIDEKLDQYSLPPECI